MKKTINKLMTLAATFALAFSLTACCCMTDKEDKKETKSEASSPLQQAAEHAEQAADHAKKAVESASEAH